jgi:hypothetical protein
VEQGALFAHVNDSIRRLVTNDSLAAEIWEFYCECSDVLCHATVKLTADEFDSRRASSPPSPIIATVHDGA